MEPVVAPTPALDIIRVDHREHPKLKGKLEKLEVAPVSIVQMEVGDVQYRDVCIERKAVGDLMNSMYSGYLFRQLEELKTNYPSPVLVVHGYVHEHFARVRGDANRSMGSYISIMATVARMGIPIVHVETDEEYLELVVSLVKQSDPNRPDSERPILTSKPSDRSANQEMEDVLCAIRGVGRKAARGLLSAFGCPLGVFQAELGDLVELDGIGKKTALHILEIGRVKYDPKSKET